LKHKNQRRKSVDREAESFAGRGFSHNTATSENGAALAAEVQLLQFSGTL
jgi:hypothetical protein